MIVEDPVEFLGVARVDADSDWRSRQQREKAAFKMALQVQGYVEMASFQILIKGVDAGQASRSIKDNHFVNQGVVTSQGFPTGFDQPCEGCVRPVSLDFPGQAEAANKVPHRSH